MAWLDGKRALVVGAGSGIGRAVLGAFQAEGAQVAALEIDKIKAERVAVELPDCPVSHGDATKMADARAAVHQATEAFGGLDILSTASASSTSTAARRISPSAAA